MATATSFDSADRSDRVAVRGLGVPRVVTQRRKCLLLSPARRDAYKSRNPIERMFFSLMRLGEVAQSIANVRFQIEAAVVFAYRHVAEVPCVDGAPLAGFSSRLQLGRYSHVFGLT